MTKGSLSTLDTITSMVSPSSDLSLANSFSKAGFKTALRYPRSVLECSPKIDYYLVFYGKHKYKRIQFEILHNITLVFFAKAAKTS